jgi:hypothetical protein
MSVSTILVSARRVVEYVVDSISVSDVLGKFAASS